MRSQFATSNSEHGETRYKPMVFTEHFALMLSSVLSSERAIEVNIQIMRIFSKIRKILADISEVRIINELRSKTENITKNIKVIFQCLGELIKSKRPQLFETKLGLT